MWIQTYISAKNPLYEKCPQQGGHLFRIDEKRVFVLPVIQRCGLPVLVITRSATIIVAVAVPASVGENDTAAQGQ